ncbi:MAG TPA: response regulator [Polyangium sp.]|nr:response regulator [Polyangium sp.]
MATSTGGAQFNRRVLVIDDQPSIHEDFRKILVGDAEPVDLDAMEAAVFGTRAPEPRRIRFEVDSAYQGAEALEMIRRARAEKRPYALAFVDVRMPPGFDGVETLSLIFEDDQDIQAVLCTAYSDWSWSAMAERLDNEGRFLILKKPFDAAEVRQMAAAMTMKWSEQAALHAAYRRQELLHTVTRLLVRSPSPGFWATSVVETIGKTLDWPFVALWCRVSEGPFECVGAFADSVREPMLELRSNSLAMDESARVLPREKIGIATFHSRPSVDQDERAALMAQAGLHGALFVPVRSGDRVLGVLEMWRNSSIAPDRGDIALLEEMCMRLGQSLDRAQVMASLARREASLRALFLALPDIIYCVDRTGNAFIPPFLHGEVVPNLSASCVLDVVPIHQHGRLLETLVRAMDTGAIHQFQFSVGTDGRRFDARIAPMFETAAIVVLRDISET